MERSAENSADKSAAPVRELLPYCRYPAQRGKSAKSSTEDSLTQGQTDAVHAAASCGDVKDKLGNITRQVSIALSCRQCNRNGHAVVLPGVQRQDAALVCNCMQCSMGHALIPGLALNWEYAVCAVQAGSPQALRHQPGHVDKGVQEPHQPPPAAEGPRLLCGCDDFIVSVVTQAALF